MLLRRTSRWSPTIQRSIPRPSYVCSTISLRQCLNQRRYASGEIQHAEHTAGTALLQAELSTITQADILEAVKANTVALYRPSHHKVHATFLLSKPFANWATDFDFTRDALTAVLQHTTDPTQQSSLPPLQVELLFAVVDAIPEPNSPYLSLVTRDKRRKAGDAESLMGQVTYIDPLKAAPVYDDGRDGFAFCVSSHEQQTDLDTVDELSSAGGHRRGTSQSIQEAQATLSFHIKDLSSGSQASRKVKVPLAKTLFTNGLQHTMVSSSWIENNATGRFELIHPQQHQHASVTIPLTRADIPEQVVLRNRWFVTAPLIPLTEPREVTASMGNIIRQLGGNDEPASNELETAVMDFYETNDMEVQAAAVWALVVPKATIKQLGAEDALEVLHVDENGKRQIVKIPSNTENPDAQRSVMLNRDIFTSIPYLLMLRGARLHKVLSGGGGWGKKAGLLSLDPESDYTSEDPTAPPRLLDLDGILDEPKPVQTVAAPGDYVRFYIAPNLPEEAFPRVGKTKGGFSRLHNNHQQTIDFGVLPSSMDDMATNDKNARHLNGKPSNKVQLKNRHIGALSEGGMSVEVTDENGAQTMLSKVDAPYSRFSYQNYTYDASLGEQNGEHDKSKMNPVQPKSPLRGISLSDALKGRINSDTLSSSHVSPRARRTMPMRHDTGKYPTIDEVAVRFVLPMSNAPEIVSGAAVRALHRQKTEKNQNNEAEKSMVGGNKQEDKSSLGQSHIRTYDMKIDLDDERVMKKRQSLDAYARRKARRQAGTSTVDKADAEGSKTLSILEPSPAAPTIRKFEHHFSKPSSRSDIRDAEAASLPQQRRARQPVFGDVAVGPDQDSAASSPSGVSSEPLTSQGPLHRRNSQDTSPLVQQDEMPRTDDYSRSRPDEGFVPLRAKQTLESQPVKNLRRPRPQVTDGTVRKQVSGAEDPAAERIDSMLRKQHARNAWLAAKREAASIPAGSSPQDTSSPSPQNQIARVELNVTESEKGEEIAMLIDGRTEANQENWWTREHRSQGNAAAVTDDAPRNSRPISANSTSILQEEVIDRASDVAKPSTSSLPQDGAKPAFTVRKYDPPRMAGKDKYPVFIKRVPAEVPGPRIIRYSPKIDPAKSIGNADIRKVYVENVAEPRKARSDSQVASQDDELKSKRVGDFSGPRRVASYVSDEEPGLSSKQEYSIRYFDRARETGKTQPETAAARARRERHQENAAGIAIARGSDPDTTSVYSGEPSGRDEQESSIETGYQDARHVYMKARAGERASAEVEVKSSEKAVPVPVPGPASTILQKLATDDGREADEFYRKRVHVFGSSSSSTKI